MFSFSFSLDPAVFESSLAGLMCVFINDDVHPISLMLHGRAYLTRMLQLHFSFSIVFDVR